MIQPSLTILLSTLVFLPGLEILFQALVLEREYLDALHGELWSLHPCHIIFILPEGLYPGGATLVQYQLVPVGCASG